MTDFLELIARVAAVAEKRLAELDAMEVAHGHFHRHVASERLRWVAVLARLAELQLRLFTSNPSPKVPRGQDSKSNDPLDKLIEKEMAETLKGKKIDRGERGPGWRESWKR
jgi:hypothetical protein